MTQRDLVPTFYLYGEPHQAVDESFVHLESLDDRSRPSAWTIRPHAHRELCHLFSIHAGGGTMRADGAMLEVRAPALLLVPAGMVHAFDWFQETAGTVLTMASTYIADLAQREPRLANAFASPNVLSLEPAEQELVAWHVGTMGRELGWSAPAHRTAIDASILSLLVLALRKSEIQSPRAMKPGSQQALIARLRARIEDKFRLREPISTYASALGVSETALRVACSRIAGRSPALMLDERAMLEARRALLYSNVTVAEIGYTLGFSDPAYFSRFFSRHAGLSPRSYRAVSRSRAQ